MRFVNPKRSTYHYNVISKLSDENRFIASGSTKGYVVDNYSWLADFVFKSAENKSLNPHVCYTSFFSDREIMYEEFCNISRIYDNYPFFSDYVRTKLPETSYEFTTKQYTTVSHRGAEFDIIEYINISDQKKFNTSNYLSKTVNGTINYNHGYWRSPAFTASGRKVHTIDESNKYDTYYWAYQWGASSRILLNSGEIILRGYDYDLSYYPNEAFDETHTYNSYSEEDGTMIKIVDVKFNIANPKYFNFEESNEWVTYYNDTIHYYEKQFMPYYGIVNFYDIDWYEIHPYTISEYDPSVLVSFFPEIIRNGVMEPAKIITNWGSNTIPGGGCATFNNGIHLNDPSDQSRIVYNICRHMISKAGLPNHTNDFSVFKKDLAGNHLYSGIDVDTERNRRYSAVVMTEPYFTTSPIANGEIVNYMFVDKDNNPITFTSDNKNIFLKIKARKNVLFELDQILNTAEYNTDIINTFKIIDPTSDEKISHILGSALPATEEYYTDFASSVDQFMQRQDDCIDDLIGNITKPGVVGTGHHVNFNISTSNFSYLSGIAKACGLGWVSKTVSDGSGNITGVTNELNIYCSNYVSKNPTEENVDKDLIDDVGIVDRTSQYEIFKPMIKLPGINGYIKIIEKNNHFKTTRAKDGLFEVVYNVEFPYCPGSYTERTLMNFAGDQPQVTVVPTYKETWILKKASYINAGSQKSMYVGEDPRYNDDNERYAPYADDSFCPHSVLVQRLASGSVFTKSFATGGGEKNIVSSQKDLVKYPADMVWSLERFNMLSLLKPMNIDGYLGYGTYDLLLADDPCLSIYSKDVKLFCLVDNRQFKFSKDKYSSYIGRENPSYICEIDVSALFKNFTQYQKTDAAIPDVKRWLMGYFSGFANMVDNIVTDIDYAVVNTDSISITEKVPTIINNDLDSIKSESDIIIEMWDSKTIVGKNESDENIIGSNWRPCSPSSSDTEKAAGSLIIDRIHISDISESSEDGIHLLFGNIYYVILGNLNENGITIFPDFVHYGVEGENGDILKGRSNLALSMKTVNDDGSVKIRNYHVIYITTFTDEFGDRQLYKAYIYYDPEVSTLPTFDPVSDVGDPYALSLYEPQKQISKNISFNINTSEIIQDIANNLLVRYIDIRSSTKESGQPFPDAQKFIDEDNKIFFRIRVVKKKNYSVSYNDKDNSSIQYKGEKIDTVLSDNEREWVNFPWTSFPFVGSTPAIDTGFDWKKVKPEEIIRKFGMTYWKCSSK